MTHPSDCPAGPIMTACEAITWVAFRRSLSQCAIGTLWTVDVARWGAWPADAVLEALRARAGLIGDGRFCAIGFPPEAGDNDPFWFHQPHHEVFTQKGPATLRAVRAIHRRSTGQLLSFQQLAEKLGAEIEADKATEAKIKAAAADLKAYAAAGKVTFSGQRWRDDGASYGATPDNPMPEPIPKELFGHPNVHISEFDEVGLFGPMKPGLHQKLPRYHSLYVATEQILAIWPVPTPVRGVEGAALASAWMAQNVRMPGEWKRESAVAQCRKDTGCTDREAKAAWNERPPEVRRSRGRPRAAHDK